MRQILLTIALIAVAQIAAQTCNGTFSGSLSAQCTDKTKPYCRNTAAPLATSDYNCVECLSHCDCGLSQYCSSDPSKGVGTCQDFTPACDNAGCECRALSAAQIGSPDWPDKTKCGVYWTYTTVGNTQAYVVDVVGACIDDSCHICTNGGTGGLGDCDQTDGTQGAKSCSLGGNFMGSYSIQWAPSNYQTNVTGVWFAIFFVFFIISIGIQIGHCCVSMRK